MDKSTAERWVTISAVVVAGVYAYRRLTESTTPTTSIKNLIGIGPLPPLGVFATAWGFMFLVISLMTEAAPGLGGGFAILIATSDLLTNSANVFADVGHQEGGTSSSSSTPSSGLTNAGSTVGVAFSGVNATFGTGTDPGIGGGALSDVVAPYEQQTAAAEVGQTPGFFDTPSGPSVYKPPPGIKVVP